jgi:flagellar assembly protein FliH
VTAKKFEQEPFRLAASDTPSPTEAPSEQEAEPVAEVDPDQLLEQAREAADETLREAEKSARQMIDEAKDRAEQILNQARERGRSDGAEEIRVEFERRHQNSTRMLSSFIEQMKKRDAELASSLASRLVDFATELAAKVIHKEIRQDMTLVTRQSEQAITKILEREKLIIRTNPSDEELMKEHKPTLVAMFDGIDRIEVIADPEIERGGCVIETDIIKVDAQPRAQLKAARAALDEEN